MSVVSLTDYQPRERYDSNAWTGVNIEASDDLVAWTQVEHIDFDDPDTDPAAPKVRNFTVVLEVEFAYLRVVWLDEENNQDVTDSISLIEQPMLATVRDVELRLSQDLTELQSEQVAVLIGGATTVILDALDKDISWTIPPEVKSLLSMLCVEVVCRARTNPAALGQESKSLGAYSHTVTYAREIPGSGLMLTNVEELLIRRAVYGVNAGSARMTPDVDEYVDLERQREPVAYVK